MLDIISIGECMVELFSDQPMATTTAFQRSFGGDTLNVLVAAARLGASTGYVTRVGRDAFGAYLLDAWRKEGIDASHARQADGFTGLYFISVLQGGQREFTYYRRGSAASTITPGDISPAYVKTARVVHLSGITQALSPTCREATLSVARLAREAGVLVSYDPNLRPALWPLSEARDAFWEVLPYVDIALPSAPEELRVLLGTESPEEAVHALWARGVKTVVVKLGKDGALVGADGALTRAPAYQAGQVVDTSGAGDALDGAFLYGITHGMSPVEAARLGCVAAGLKVCERGTARAMPHRAQVMEALEK